MAREMDPHTIVYLRPQREEAIALLDLDENQNFVEDVPPPLELCDIRIEGIAERAPSSRLSLHPDVGPNSNLSRESTPGLYAIHSRALRIGFNTKTHHTARGYYFGSLPDCHVKMPYHGKRSSQGCYFCIHYNFNSGALLLLAMSTMTVGSTTLEKDQSLLVIADAVIDCGNKAFQFMVEFPDLNQCAAAHERNYQEYVAKFNLGNVLYMATSRAQDPPIGYLYKSKALLGRGAFGEVHRAVHIHNGELCAIKMLPDEEDRDTLQEAKVLSKLCHPSIVEYWDAFVFNKRVCIVMELAANDLYKHRNSKKGGRKPYLPLRGIKHIICQLLLGIEYMHGEGITHRDLKPTNILVTGWDSKTDLLTVKLADFGLASINPDLSSLCGTAGYLAPEIEAEIAWQKRRKKQAAAGFKTVSRHFQYDNSVDIWALGKIMKELLDEMPPEIRVRGRKVLVNKVPAMDLAQLMMHPSPKERPTASLCLQHHWLMEDKLGACKRQRSKTPDASTAMSSKRIVHEVQPASKGSTEILMEWMFPDSQGLGRESNLTPNKREPLSVQQVLTSADIPNLSIVKIKGEAGNHVDVTAHFRDGRILSQRVANPGDDGAAPIPVEHEASEGSALRLQAMIERALAESASLNHRTKLDDVSIPAGSLRLEIELNDKIQSIWWQSATSFTAQAMNECFGEPGPTLYQLPTINVNHVDVIMPDVPSQLMSMPGEGRPNGFSDESAWSSISDLSKGVTYPSEYDGVTTDISQIVEKQI